MSKALNVAQNLVNLSIERAEETSDNSYLITFYKMHKLLYYAQGLSLIKNGRVLFDEDIHAYHCGPFIEELSDFLLTNVDNPAKEKFATPKLSDEDMETLEKTISFRGRLDGRTLGIETKKRDAWKNAIAREDKAVISVQDIQDDVSTLIKESRD